MRLVAAELLKHELEISWSSATNRRPTQCMSLRCPKIEEQGYSAKLVQARSWDVLKCTVLEKSITHTIAWISNKISLRHAQNSMTSCLSIELRSILSKRYVEQHIFAKACNFAQLSWDKLREQLYWRYKHAIIRLGMIRFGLRNARPPSSELSKNQAKQIVDIR